MINVDQLQNFSGRHDQQLVDALNDVMQRFEINTARRIRYFMAQSSFESNNYSKFEEVLMYSTPERLVAVWPTRFALNSVAGRAVASEYVRNPQKLANFVYANRNGNGPPESGDGWKFRGRGVFGLTFSNNYRQYSTDVYGDSRCLDDPDLVSKIVDGVMSAGWFWNRNGFNALADADEFTKVTTIINGSAATVPQRITVLNHANQIF